MQLSVLGQSRQVTFSCHQDTALHVLHLHPPFHTVIRLSLPINKERRFLHRVLAMHPSFQAPRASLFGAQLLFMPAQQQVKTDPQHLPGSLVTQLGGVLPHLHGQVSHALSCSLFNLRAKFVHKLKIISMKICQQLEQLKSQRSNQRVPTQDRPCASSLKK